MSSFINRNLNEIISNHFKIKDFYMQSICNDIKSLYSGKTIEVNEIDMHYQLSGYDLNQSKENNISLLDSLSDQICGLSKKMFIPVMLTYLNFNSSFSTYVSSNHKIAPAIRNSISNTLSNVSISNKYQIATSQKIVNLQKNNIYLTGSFLPNDSVIDFIAETYRDNDWMINLYISPIPESEIEEELLLISTYLTGLKQATENEFRTEHRYINSSDQSLLSSIEVLETEKNYLEHALNTGLWSVIIHISSDNNETSLNVASSLLGVLEKQENGTSRTHYSNLIRSNISFISGNHINLPMFFMGENQINSGLYSHSLINLCDKNNVISLIRFAHSQHKDYMIKNYGVDDHPLGPFLAYGNSSNGKFQLGKINDNETLHMSLDDLHMHCLIVGATQTGKSTTVRKILSEIYGKVPFLVIEAARKDYWDKLAMCQGMNNIKVYSSGFDALDLRINPFIPEDNVSIRIHKEILKKVFMSYIPDDGPIEAIVRSLVDMCYKDKGLTDNVIAGFDNDIEYPVLEDMARHVEKCIDNIGYDAEISQRMKGVMNVRIQALIDAGGDCLNTHRTLSIADMMENGAIVELDDFESDTKTFVASLLAMKFREYSGQMNTSDKLNRLLVIEEAHHLLANPELRGVTSSMASSSIYFSNMLAELSGYGSGIIVIDQRPNKISSDALANTATKIIHRLNEGEDIERIRISLNLNNGTYISDLKPGEAIVRSIQMAQNARIKITPYNSKKTNNVACLFGWQIDSKVISHIGDNEIKYIRASKPTLRLLEDCIKNIENGSLIEFELNQKASLAGELLNYMNINNLTKRRLMYSYNKKLRLER